MLVVPGGLRATVRYHGQYERLLFFSDYSLCKQRANGTERGRLLLEKSFPLILNSDHQQETKVG